MHHCHPCFGGHKPTGPICTTAPVIHPTKQCVTHSFQQRWCHTFSQHIQHMYIINKLKPKLLPANKFKCKCCAPNRPRIRRRMHRVAMDIMDIMDITYHHLVLWTNVSPFDQTYHHSTEYWTKRITIRSKYPPNVGGMFKSNDMLELAKC